MSDNDHSFDLLTRPDQVRLGTEQQSMYQSQTWLDLSHDDVLSNCVSFSGAERDYSERPGYDSDFHDMKENMNTAGGN